MIIIIPFIFILILIVILILIITDYATDCSVIRLVLLCIKLLSMNYIELFHGFPVDSIWMDCLMDISWIGIVWLWLWL